MTDNNKDKRPTIKIDREEEERSKDISRFISEGGLGARTKYYDIKKVSNEDKDDDSKED